LKSKDPIPIQLFGDDEYLAALLPTLATYTGVALEKVDKIDCGRLKKATFVSRKQDLLPVPVPIVTSDHIGWWSAEKQALDLAMGWGCRPRARCSLEADIGVGAPHQVSHSWEL
jgi:hypothetical protein